jgi:1L-myo-inositol 1-phosphate cytidylyltransferase / CDP-L-myo-inositol myo-inositolphosphotransferase
VSGSLLRHGWSGDDSERRDRSGRPRLGVVLAAGRSQRLIPVTNGGSKALIRVGGVSLVERAVRVLLAEGLDRVVVVVGFQAEAVAALVDRIAPDRVTAVRADNWQLGNGVSLSAAEPFASGDDAFILITTDHVFEEGALTPLVARGRPAVLVDHTPEAHAWAEGTRVRELDERVVEFSKDLVAPSIDCGAFLLPVQVFDAHRRARARGDGSLAGAVTELATTTPLEAVPLRPGARWLDVDTPQDLRRLMPFMRRSLAKDGDGPVSRYLNRPLSTRLSVRLANLPVSPNAVSFAAFGVAVGAAVALANGAAVLGALLVQLASVLDGVDGEIARLQVRSSPRGALLDGVLDRLADGAIIGGLGAWALASDVTVQAVIWLAVLATVGAMLSMATKDRISALGLRPTPERRIALLLGGRDGRLLLIAVCALFGRPVLALAVVSVTSLTAVAVRLTVAYTSARPPR